MNRILLSLLSASLLTSSPSIRAESIDDYNIRAGARYAYRTSFRNFEENPAKFTAKLDELSKDPVFLQKFNRQVADRGCLARDAAEDGAISGAVTGMFLGTLVGLLIDARAQKGNEQKDTTAQLKRAGITALITGALGACAHAYYDAKHYLSHQDGHHRPPGEDATEPESMADIWVKTHKWDTFTAPGANTSSAYHDNLRRAHLKKDMQDNPEFEENFINRIVARGKVAHYDAAKTAIVGAKFGAKYGAIGGAISGALTCGIRQLNANNGNTFQVEKSAIAKAMLSTSLACAASLAAIGAAGGYAVGAINSVDRVSDADIKEQYNIPLENYGSIASLTSNRWAGEHQWATLFSSAESIRNRVHAEIDPINLADYGL